MLITTNQSVTQWGQVFGDDVIATAILDRLLHHSPTFHGPGRELSPPPEAQSGAAAAPRAVPGILDPDPKFVLSGHPSNDGMPP